MTPRPRENHSLTTGPLEECDEIITDKIPPEVYEPEKRKNQIVWLNVIIIGLLHLKAIYGLYLVFTSAKLFTFIHGVFLYELSVIGVTMGAHRLWSHRSYKAKWPLKLLLVTCQTLAHQNSVIVWARDHRLHHKFQGTDADPHNVKRGFFFSHCGWLMCKKHPEVINKGKGIDLSDLHADPLLRFQHKYFFLLMPVVCFIIPTIIPMMLWNETFMNSYFLNILRYVIGLTAAFLGNSAAHIWGSKPYDKHISPTENLLVSILTTGEGCHNYHHTFPWDYKTAELGKINLTLKYINFFAKIGWAYDLKTVSTEMVQKRVQRTGDGSHEIWGWGDKDQTAENYQSAVIYNKQND